MNDPHVESLRYRLVPLQTDDVTVEYDSAPPLAFATPEADGHLEDGNLNLRMRSHYPSADEARAAVEPYLEAWQVKTALASGRPEISFDYDDVELIDRDPPPPPQPGDPVVVKAGFGVAIATAGSVSLRVGRSAYPPPPDDFVIDPDTETLWHRYSGYVAGREPLQGMAYFCHTLVERNGERLGISANVIEKLGHLASTTGDRFTARKASHRPLEPGEDAWLVAAVKALIVRSGQVAADPKANHPKLTLGDLPPLPKGVNAGHIRGHEGPEPA